MEELAGLESQHKSTNIPNTLDLPQSVASIDQALVALVRYTTVVDELLQRAGDASTSSRLASRYQIIELIGTLFVKVLPAPDPSTVALAFEQAKATEDWEDDEEEPEYPVLYCYELQTQPTYQGRGLGKRLMEVLSNTCSKLKLNKVMLTCFNINESALAFYKAIGFKVDDNSPSKCGFPSDYEILSKE